MSTNARAYGDPATRKQILAAAWSLAEEGGSDLRLVDIGARAGVSRRAIYLHFGDRAGLLAALVEFLDEEIGVDTLAEPVRSAGSPDDLLAAVVTFYAQVNPRIDAVARLLEARPQDAAARAAWRSRMDMRRRIHRDIMRTVHDDGGLAPGWTVDAAADLLHALMLPSTWRELTDEVGWTTEDVRAHLTTVVARAFLTSSS